MSQGPQKSRNTCIINEITCWDLCGRKDMCVRTRGWKLTCAYAQVPNFIMLFTRTRRASAPNRQTFPTCACAQGCASAQVVILHWCASAQAVPALKTVSLPLRVCTHRSVRLHRIEFSQGCACAQGCAFAHIRKSWNSATLQNFRFLTPTLKDHNFLYKIPIFTNFISI